jgi:hypothetical protein
MALANYEHDLATHIASGIGTLTLGTNIFAGPLRSPKEGAPQLTVGCVLTPGPVPVELMSGGTTRLYEPSLTVTIRCNQDEYQNGRDLAEQIYERVHNGSVSGYQWARCMQGTPVYAGMSENRNFYFTINVTMARLEG